MTVVKTSAGSLVIYTGTDSEILDAMNTDGVTGDTVVSMSLTWNGTSLVYSALCSTTRLG